MARGFKIADAYVDIHADRDGIKRDVQDIPRRIGPDADKAGKGIGDKVSQGMKMSLVRNSPLIVAAIAGGLAAGAPLMLTAATAMFAGVGIAAAVQSEKVRSAWVGLGGVLKREADDIAGPMTDVLVGAAGKTAAAYQRMKPQLIDAMAAVAPQVDILVDSILGMTENALPGMVRGVQSARPVIEGFGAFLEKTGTGLSDFFLRLSQHSPEAGAAMSSLGDIMGELLPLLAELLGQGAELASQVLPLVAGSMGAVLDVVTMLGPALPAVVAGFTALKIARSVTGWLDGAAASMAANAAQGGIMAGTQGRVASGMKSVAAAAGPVGIAIGVVSAAYMRGKQASDDYARSLMEGGTAADEARKNLAIEGTVDSVASSMGGLGNVVAMFTSSTEEATQAQKDLEAAMSPGQVAAMRLRQAENELAQAIEEHGAGSREAAAAQKEHERATANNARVQGELETALHGVTEAMLTMADQALASIDSGFAYQHSLNAIEDAQAAVNEAVKEHGAGSEEAQRAVLDLAEANYRAALAFGQQQADMSGAAKDSQEYARIVQQGALQELYRLRDAAGPQMAGALQQQIDRLEAAGVSLQETGSQANAVSDRMRDLGLSVRQVPGYKGVEINAPTEDQRRRIQNLGYQIITLPNGRVYVTADTWDAQNRLAALERARTTTLYVNTVVRQGQQATGRGLYAASGGSVERIVRGFAGGGMPSRREATGRLVGPGGPLDDLIPAITTMGEFIRVANEEWIINGRVSREQGAMRMAALNSGRADIVPRFADGGTPAGTRVTPSGRAVQNLHVHLSGTFDLRDRAGMRKLAVELKDMLDTIEREAR